MRLSKNDVVSGLAWVLRCLLAGRALPGHPGSGRFLVALDLSANGLPAGVLPPDFTGNCAQPLDVPAPEAGGPHDPVPPGAPRLLGGGRGRRRPSARR